MTTAAYLYLGAVLFAVGAFGSLVRTSVAGRLVDSRVHAGSWLTLIVRGDRRFELLQPRLGDPVLTLVGDHERSSRLIAMMPFGWRVFGSCWK